MQIIGGKKYYTVNEAAKLAGVSVRTLRRWLADNRLSDFLYPFRAGPNEMLYRMEEPEADEPRNEKGEWLVIKDQAAKGGVPDESNSRS